MLKKCGSSHDNYYLAGMFIQSNLELIKEHVMRCRQWVRLSCSRRPIGRLWRGDWRGVTY